MNKLFTKAFIVVISFQLLGSLNVQCEDMSPRSSDIAYSLNFSKEETVIDFDLSKKSELAILIKSENPSTKSAEYKAIFSDLSKSGTRTGSWNVPADIAPKSIVWHPNENEFFILGAKGKDYVILNCSKKSNGWQAQQIYKTKETLRRLIIGPTEFAYYSKDTEHSSYRLFFGVKMGSGKYLVRTILSNGQKAYDVLSPNSKKAVSEDDPTTLAAISALPMAFHPAGHVMVWQDENHGFNLAIYGRESWAQTKKLDYLTIKEGTISITPNGLGFIFWQSGHPGVELIYNKGKTRKKVAEHLIFTGTPSSRSDGKGIVGLIKTDAGQQLIYAPIDMPLADVENAWMFTESPQDLELFASRGGLFRSLGDGQLHSLYETENYQCGGYDRSTPTRPYYVTTDIFWETFSAAYEGVFLATERQKAIPDFWNFIRSAHEYFRDSKTSSRWRNIFLVLRSIEDRQLAGGDERDRIEKADGIQTSSVLGEPFNYSELKPRGHYTSSPSLIKYFKAFNYLSHVHLTKEMVQDLKSMPPSVQNKAVDWIHAYSGLIAPSRGPLVFDDSPVSTQKFIKHPGSPRIFPLSWGFDNEILNSTVFHQDWPQTEQVKGPGGLRLNPSGLDLVAALGSDFSMTLLRENKEFEKYPPLETIISDLRKRFRDSDGSPNKKPSLYEQWVSALAVQWADDVSSPSKSNDEKIWHSKRLQTGLASWATLRHATVLVNERTVAECGESGFEFITFKTPRGSVEQDPKTFEKIADLFDGLSALVNTTWGEFPDKQIGDPVTYEKDPVKQGVLRRLSESAKDARYFGSMAAKELRSELLLEKENEDILTVAGVAEHNFLIFKSLANKDFAISQPDPIGKVADVAGGANGVPYTMAAVGDVLQWDQIVPIESHHQIVKGAVYSYFEFQSEKLLNDKEWREIRPKQDRPWWIKPFMSDDSSSCPAKPPF